MLHQHTLRIRLLIICGLLCGLVMTTLLLTPAQAPVQALPPRPTPLVTIAPTAVPSSYVREGGLIELHVQPARVGLWTLIQWQDARGQWHDVDGWQGTVDGDIQIWWVAPRDFGKGPFRWRIYQSRGGLLLANSEAFSLPRHTGEIVRVDVALKP
jgi:hypothetical protein